MTSQNALSKLDNFKSANNLLWQRTDKDSVRQAEVASLSSNPESECTATPERLGIIERASIYAVNDYDACRTHYMQFILSLMSR